MTSAQAVTVATLEAILDGFNRHDLDAIMAFFADDATLDTPRGSNAWGNRFEGKAAVREGMELGAVGLSTGLMYEPGMWSTTEEVVELARQVAPYRGIYDSHVREPVWKLIESDEAALRSGVLHFCRYAADAHAYVSELGAIADARAK